MLAVALISAWNTIHGRGLLGFQSMVYAVLSLHFLLTVFVTSFLLSVHSLLKGNAAKKRCARNAAIWSMHGSRNAIASHESCTTTFCSD